MATPDKKKKKKTHWVWSTLKWTGAVAAGAVVGAYSVRWIDSLRKPTTALPAGAEGTQVLEVEEGALASNPMLAPGAAMAITPIMPAMPMMPSMMSAMPMQASQPASPSGRYEAPAEPNPDPPRMSAKELRAQRRSDFEDLMERFENDPDFNF